MTGINYENLFRSKYQETILCEYQRELALVKQMIETAEDAVRIKKPIDM